jgi:hypothetical protein
MRPGRVPFSPLLSARSNFKDTGGISWTSAESVSAAGASAPAVAADGAGRWILSWQSTDDLAGTIGGDPDILFALSLDADTDADGVGDLAELTQFGSNPQAQDSDGDGLIDGAEVNVYGTNPVNADTDGDGVDDGTEIAAGTDPLRPGNSVPGLSLTGLSMLGGLLCLLGMWFVRRSIRSETVTA